VVNGALAVFDSGTSLNLLPTVDYLEIISVITAGKNCTLRHDLNNSTYCQCNPKDVSEFPDLTLSFGAVKLEF
jgi:hypothetical protein